MPPTLPSLPIDAYLPELCASLRASSSLVLIAEPGAGKTTRLPPALLDSGKIEGEILVLEPRRLAARLAARRVAEERGERVGETVGYQVRFEEVAGPKTRIRFVTEGVLVRRLIADPMLRGVGAVVLDEFHERHLEGDLALALLRRLQQTGRPELKLVVMSATLDPGPIAAFLGDAPQWSVPGRRFEVAIEYLPAPLPTFPQGRPFEVEVASAIRRFVGELVEPEGDLLVFLPGAAEIRRTREALEPFAASKGWSLVPLHGDLPPAEQDRAVAPGRRGERKLVLSTNVAETSVTLEGVVAVVDSGWARVASHSPWTGLPTLKRAKVSRASAIQRAGRAGRVRAGRCLRLYTRHDFDSRPERELPEVSRSDLAATGLMLHGLGVASLSRFPWFEEPPGAALDAAETLLERLGAIGREGRLTPQGERMLRLPLHPRQAKLFLEAEARGCGEAGATLAAILGERELSLDARGGFGDRRTSSGSWGSGPSDLLERLELFEQAERRQLEPQALRSLGLDAGAAHAVSRVKKSLWRPRGGTPPSPASSDARDETLLIATAAAFPDRVGRRRGDQLVLVSGGAARFSESSVVREAPFAVAVDVEERSGGSAAGREALIRMASRVEPLWLLELFPERVAESVAPIWNGAAERVEWMERLSYDGLMLEESRVAERAPEATAALLFEQAKAKGLRFFCDPERFDQLLERLRFAQAHVPEVALPELEPFLEEACLGLRSFDELREADLLGRLEATCGHQLERLAPAELRLPGGRRARIVYAADKPPSIASRLQDFFGMADGPKLANGRVPLVLELLAPNQRAVQVTTDLAGFWSRHYPAIRKELCRRYPRHAWPEDPLTATPPAPRPPRRPS